MYRTIAASLAHCAPLVSICKQAVVFVLLQGAVPCTVPHLVQGLLVLQACSKPCKAVCRGTTWAYIGSAGSHKTACMLRVWALPWHTVNLTCRMQPAHEGRAVAGPAAPAADMLESVMDQHCSTSCLQGATFALWQGWLRACLCCTTTSSQQWSILRRAVLLPLATSSSKVRASMLVPGWRWHESSIPCLSSHDFEHRAAQLRPCYMSLRTEARILCNSVTRDSQEPENYVSPMCFCPAADAVVISVPLGVLKKETIAFQPPLPQRKQTAIRQLGFGVLNKVCLRPASQFPQLQLCIITQKDLF